VHGQIDHALLTGGGFFNREHSATGAIGSDHEIAAAEYKHAEQPAQVRSADQTRDSRAWNKQAQGSTVNVLQSSPTCRQLFRSDRCTKNSNATAQPSSI